MIHQVTDHSFQTVSNSTYDMAFFASGYEKRCTHLAKLLHQGKASQNTKIVEPIILGFLELNHSEPRIVNDRYFAKHWTDNQVNISADDEAPIYQLLSSIKPNRGRIKILVDYSSMSRLWYSGILNWARFSPYLEEIIIDLVYAVGSHKGSALPMVIKDVVCIPGCEGGAAPIFRSVAVFGLGFEGLAALCVLDRLEPDEVYCYLASPAAFKDYPTKAQRINRDIIKHSKATLKLPLSSVETSYTLLTELVAPHRNEADVIFIPMGPKPHVLAAILMAMRFDGVACLRVSGKRSEPEQVEATGELVVTRVRLKPPPCPSVVPHILSKP